MKSDHSEAVKSKEDLDKELTKKVEEVNEI